MNRMVALGLLLFASTLWGQTAADGTVVKWESKPYSQSAHIIRNHIVYSVQIGDTVLQIARRSDKQEMATGEHIKCRVDSGRVYVVNEKGRETKYDIVGSESTPDVKRAK